MITEIVKIIQVASSKKTFYGMEAAFNILEKAKRDFTFRGGRMPSMTLESKSNSFYNIYGRDVSLWIIRQFEKAEILPRPDLKQAVADLLAAHAMKEGGREPTHRICQTMVISILKYLLSW